MRCAPAHPLSSPGPRLLAAWAALGATVQACLPALHGLDTMAGPAALWLWGLPLASLALALLLLPAAAKPSAAVRQPVRRASRGRASAGLPMPSRCISRARTPTRPAPGRRLQVG